MANQEVLFNAQCETKELTSFLFFKKGKSSSRFSKIF